MDLVYFVAMLFALPTLLYVAGRYAAPAVWGLVVKGHETRGGGIYRAAVVPILKPGSAPFVVKAAAVSCFLFGQMAVPGALAALVGLYVTATMLFDSSEHFQPLIGLLTLSAPSGLYIAGGLISAGMLMLRRDIGAAQLARKIARVSLIHNGVLMAIVLVLCLVPRIEMIGAALPLVYGTLSILQALLVRAAADELDRLDVRDEPVRDAHTEEAISIG